MKATELLQRVGVRMKVPSGQALTPELILQLPGRGLVAESFTNPL